MRVGLEISKELVIMNDLAINYCHEIAKEMDKLEFNEASVSCIKNSNEYHTAFNKPPEVQRTYMTMLLYGILMGAGIPVSKDIRIALNIAADTHSWFVDIKLVILPFLKANEALFFKS